MPDSRRTPTCRTPQREPTPACCACAGRRFRGLEADPTGTRRRDRRPPPPIGRPAAGLHRQREQVQALRRLRPSHHRLPAGGTTQRRDPARPQRRRVVHRHRRARRNAPRRRVWRRARQLRAARCTVRSCAHPPALRWRRALAACQAVQGAPPDANVQNVKGNMRGNAEAKHSEA